MIDVSRLIHRWLEEAESLRSRHGDMSKFCTILGFAQDLDDFLEALGMETLNLQEAAKESGYSVNQLLAYIYAGTIPNAGCQAYPAIARRDLPRRPGFRVSGSRGIQCPSEDEPSNPHLSC